jgi:hypothetical protein
VEISAFSAARGGGPWPRLCQLRPRRCVTQRFARLGSVAPQKFGGHGRECQSFAPLFSSTTCTPDESGSQDGGAPFHAEKC